METNLRKLGTAKKRRRVLARTAGGGLPALGKTVLRDEMVSRNCENFIGAAQIPIGVAGPLKVDGQNYFIPLATTEAGLVASINRGCKAITRGGGCSAAVERVGMTRAPVFKTSPAEGKKLVSWVRKNFNKLARRAVRTSKHIALLRVEEKAAPGACFLRFVYDTQDAMGMNMATIATASLVLLIEKETGVRCVSLAGNYDVDKKPSRLNLEKGRGFRVWAKTSLPAEIVREVLKTTPEAILEVYKYKIGIGSALAGLLGANAHIANTAAAFFAATGQDIAHTVEAAIGRTHVEKAAGGLDFSVYLPDLPLGTVGGGTGLPTQKEALSILGVYGGDGGRNAEKLAAVFAAACLAGEISLLAALAEGTLAQTHARLAWGKQERMSNY